MLYDKFMATPDISPRFPKISFHEDIVTPQRAQWLGEALIRSDRFKLTGDRRYVKVAKVLVDPQRRHPSVIEEMVVDGKIAKDDRATLSEIVVTSRNLMSGSQDGGLPEGHQPVTFVVRAHRFERGGILRPHQESYGDATDVAFVGLTGKTEILDVDRARSARVIQHVEDPRQRWEVGSGQGVVVRGHPVAGEEDFESPFFAMRSGDEPSVVLALEQRYRPVTLDLDADFD